MPDPQDTTPPANSTSGQAPARLAGATPSSVEWSERAAPANQETTPYIGTAASSGFPVVPGYAVEEELGRGGMGVVYRARQVGLDRTVALKMILHAEYAGAEARLRFEREARALARLRHEHIVQVHDTGEQDGRPYFVLEFIEGGSLAQKLKEGPLPPREVAALLEQLARGVQAAHEAGIVHRDLKPGNILLTTTGVPKVADFGLARDERGDEHTRTGAIMGTPAYMAPEQARGRTREVGPAADVWALGAILYECLIGRVPFRAPSVAETLRLVCETEPEAPRSRQPSLPRDLETVCLRCLEKDPTRRYASAGELADDLARFNRGEPVLARPVSRPERVWRWCRRNPAPAGLLLSLLLGTSAALTLALWALGERDRANENAEKADSEWRSAERAREYATEKGGEALREATEARRQASRLALNEGLKQFDLGHVPEGFTWVTRSVQLAPEGEDHVQRLLLAAWQPYLHPVVAHWDAGQPVSAPVFSPDGLRVAAIKDDKSVQVWDTRSGKPVVNVPKDVSSLLAGPGERFVKFSPDGKLLLVGGHFGDLRIWDIEANKELDTWAKGGKSVSAVTHAEFTPDGKRVALACDFSKPIRKGRVVGVWDLRTAEPVWEPVPYLNPSPIILSPDGKVLAAGCRDRSVRLWDANSGEAIGKPLPQANAVLALAFRPDGKVLAVGTGQGGNIIIPGLEADAAVQYWDVAEGKPIGQPLRHPGRVLAVAFSPNGQIGLSGSTGGMVRLVGKRTIILGVKPKGLDWPAEPLAAPLRVEGGVGYVGFTQDGKRFWASGSAGLSFWTTGAEDAGYPVARPYALPTRDGKTVFAQAGRQGLQLLAVASLSGPTRSLYPPEDPPAAPVGNHDRQAGYAAGGRFFFIRESGRFVRVWDVATCRRVGPPIPAKGPEPAVSPDGRFVADVSPVGKDGSVQLFATATGERQGDPVVFPGERPRLFFSPEKNTLLILGQREARVWDIPDGSVRLCREKVEGTPTIRVRADGQARIVARLSPRSVVVRDLVTGEALGPPLEHSSEVSRQMLPTAGPALVVLTIDGTMHLWDSASGTLLAARKIEDSWGHVEFSRDGTLVAVQESKQQVRVWDARTGKALGPPLKHPIAVSILTFSPDSTLLLTSCIENPGDFSRSTSIVQLRVWHTRTGVPLGPVQVGSWGRNLVFTPDGSTLCSGEALSGTLFGESYRWKLPTALPGDRDHLTRWAQTVTNMEVDEAGAIVPLDADTWRDRRKGLD